MPKQAARRRTRPRQRAHRVPTRAPRGSTRATGRRARACSLLQGRRGERCVTPAGGAARIERLGHRRARGCADVEPPRRPDCACTSTSVHAGPGVLSARPTPASADLDRTPAKENARLATRWRASVRCPRRARWDVSVTLCKEDRMKPVPLLFLLACSAVLACVALAQPLPRASDPANDRAPEAAYPPPQELRA